MTPTIKLIDCFFDLDADGSRLRIGVLDGPAPREFWCRLKFLPGMFVKFTHVADLRNQRIYEACEARHEVEGGEVRQPVGPDWCFAWSGERSA